MAHESPMNLHPRARKRELPSGCLRVVRGGPRYYLLMEIDPSLRSDGREVGCLGTKAQARLVLELGCWRKVLELAARGRRQRADGGRPDGEDQRLADDTSSSMRTDHQRTERGDEGHGVV